MSRNEKKHVAEDAIQLRGCLDVEEVKPGVFSIVYEGETYITTKEVFQGMESRIRKAENKAEQLERDIVSLEELHNAKVDKLQCILGEKSTNIRDLSDLVKKLYRVIDKKDAYIKELEPDAMKYKKFKANQGDKITLEVEYVVDLGVREGMSIKDTYALVSKLLSNQKQGKSISYETVRKRYREIESAYSNK